MLDYLAGLRSTEDELSWLARIGQFTPGFLLDEHGIAALAGQGARPSTCSVSERASAPRAMHPSWTAPTSWRSTAEPAAASARRASRPGGDARCWSRRCAADWDVAGMMVLEILHRNAAFQQ